MLKVLKFPRGIKYFFNIMFAIFPAYVVVTTKSILNILIYLNNKFLKHLGFEVNIFILFVIINLCNCKKTFNRRSLCSRSLASIAGLHVVPN